MVVDALFGFSFHGAPRPPFDALLRTIGGGGAPPVVSIDVPSGWDVDRGDVSGDGLRPDMLISLTAPKLCARAFAGRHHYLGVRARRVCAAAGPGHAKWWAQARECCMWSHFA